MTARNPGSAILIGVFALGSFVPACWGFGWFGLLPQFPPSARREACMSRMAEALERNDSDAFIRHARILVEERLLVRRAGSEITRTLGTPDYKTCGGAEWAWDCDPTIFTVAIDSEGRVVEARTSMSIF
jgi:hypothetical protein